MKRGNEKMKEIKVTNSAIEYFLAKFRDKGTDIYYCNLCVENISFFLAGELSDCLEKEEKSIQTPLGVKNCSVISEEVILIPVLRAGLSMLSGFQRMLPQSRIGFILAHRNEKAEAEIDNYRFPDEMNQKTVILLDTMLATAGTVNAAAKLLWKYNPKQILCASVLATETGLNKLSPYVSKVFYADSSDTLDERMYIYPGVGDSGDRLFG